MKTTSHLKQPSLHFCQHFMRRTTQETLLAINLVSQQKTTKLYFSSQVRKQFKLLTVPFKPLHCCLRSDRLVNCHVWKFCKDLFLNFCDIWSVKLSDFVEITSCIYNKTIFFSISVNSGFRNIYLASSRLGKYIFSHYSPRFQRIFVKYPTKAEFINCFIIHLKQF